MREMICIVCPRGCRLSVDRLPDGNISVSGMPVHAACLGESEVLDPRRTVTATCALIPASDCNDDLGKRLFCQSRRLPVKTSAPCPKERIPELLSDIYKLEIKAPVGIGKVLIKDWKGLGFDVVASAGF